MLMPWSEAAVLGWQKRFTSPYSSRTIRDLPNSKVIQQVEDVLVAERALLVSGDFKALERLEVDKEKVIAAIRPMSEKDLQELRHLRGLAEHNQQLFKQALKGIQDVSDRLESIRKLARLSIPMIILAAGFQLKHSNQKSLKNALKIGF